MSASEATSYTQLGISLPSDLAAAMYDVYIKFSSFERPQLVFAYLVQVGNPQILSIAPISAFASTEIAIATRTPGGGQVSWSSSDLEVTFSQAGSVLGVGSISSVSSQNLVTVLVPHIDSLQNIVGVDVSISTPQGTATITQGFDWLAPVMPNGLSVTPMSGLNSGGFQVSCTVEAFVTLNQTEPTAREFFVTFGATSITDFSVQYLSSTSEAAQSICQFTFTAPTALQAGLMELLVGLIAEPHKLVSFGIRVDEAAEPYLSGLLSPSQCYSSGGGTVSATISNLAPEALATAPVVTWAGTTNVTAETTVAGNDLAIRFPIPKAQMLGTHSESINIVFGPTVIASTFLFKELPAAEISFMNVSTIAINGGTPVLLTARNLGVQSAESKLSVVISAGNLIFHAIVSSTVCDVGASGCDAGLAECTVVFVTPQMFSLTETGAVLLQVYWEHLGVTQAATSQALHVYNPAQASIPANSVHPAEGYVTENTRVSIQLFGMSVYGQYPSAKDAILASFTAPGFTAPFELQVVQCQLVTSADGTQMNAVTILMPTFTSAVSVTISVQLKLAPTLRASADFMYHSVPTAAPRLQASPLTGAVSSRTKVLLDLSPFYVCATPSDVVIEFVDTALQRYAWDVVGISSSMQQTTIQVYAPVIASGDYAHVYEATGE